MKSLIAAFSLAALLAGATAAQNYPTRPIVVVVPFTAGGPTDALMRVLGERMRTTLGESLLVENVTGAAGTIGVGRVVRAAPNGYTLSVGHWSTHVVNGAIYPLEFDLLKDLAPVAQLTNYPMVLVAKNAVPAKDVKEFIAWARAHKDKISAGSVGVGSAAHVAGIYFQNLTGLQFQYVSYRGAAPALQEVMAGQIEFLFDHLSHSLPHVRAGKVRAYAVTAPARSPSAPDIPTFDEAGVPKLHVSIWYGLWAPRGTPKDIVDKLNGAVREALADAGVRKRLSDLGQIILPPAQQTPEALAAHQKAEIDKWWPLIKAANIKVE
jgi:tripartite-type tricarboxylate transporter receptor subunit TctC